MKEMLPLDPKNIRQLTIDDFDQIYEIWKEGASAAFSNPDLNLTYKDDFYQSFFKNALLHQTEAFRYWGYFEGNILIGYHSLLPCQAAPIAYHMFAETSLYIRKGFRANGLGQFLMRYSFDYANQNSEIAYIMGTTTTLNKKSINMLIEVGFTEIGDVSRSKKDQIYTQNDNPKVWFYVM